MHGPAVSYWSDRVKAETSLGHIGDDPAVVRRQIDIGKSFQGFSLVKAAFRRHRHKHAPRL